MLVLNKLKNYVLKHRIFIDGQENNSFIWTINNKRALYCKYITQNWYYIPINLITYYKNNIDYPCVHEYLSSDDYTVFLYTIKTTWEVIFDDDIYRIRIFDKISNRIKYHVM